MSVAAARPHETLDAAAVLAGAVIDLAGLPIRLSASDAVRAEAVASLFRHARISPAGARCSVHFGDEDVAVPQGPPSATLAQARLWYAAPATQWIHTDNGLTARGDDRAIVIVGRGASLARDFRYVCLLALTHLLARHGLHLLHAAAVVVDERAVLVLGGTGTGKSTLAYAAHRLGWPVLADDAVLVQRRDASVLARGLPRPMAVPADVARDTVGGGRPVPDDARNRIELPFGTLADTVNPVVAVLVTHGADDHGPGIAPLSGPEVLRMVLQASGSLADPAVRPQLFALAGDLARLPGWSLHHGPVPTPALDEATQLLGALAALLQ